MIDSTDKLEREIEAGRSRLDATLSKLQDRLHPAAVADELIGVGRRSGASSNLYDVALATLRGNPIPILLIGAGVAWLVSSTRRGAHAMPPERHPVPMRDPGALQRRRNARIYPAPG